MQFSRTKQYKMQTEKYFQVFEKFPVFEKLSPSSPPGGPVGGEEARPLVSDQGGQTGLN